MGLLDFDFTKVTENPLFQFGSGIAGANYGHYGAFAPALHGGIQNMTQQQMLARENALKQQQMEMQRKLLEQQQQDREAIHKFTGGVPLDLYKYKNPPAPNSAAIAGYNIAKSQGYPGSFMDYQTALKRAGSSQINNFMTGKLSPGQETYDKESAKQMAEFDAGGGYADSMKNLQQLRDAKARLESNDNLTGPLVGNVPSFAAPFVTPEAIDVKEQVEEVVQRNLRLILGAQFTAKEGDQLIARAYNPKLDESVNAKRVCRLVNAIEQALIQRQDAANYFKQNGTLRGWQGKMPKMADFYAAIESDEPTDSGGNSASEFDALWNNQ